MRNRAHLTLAASAVFWFSQSVSGQSTPGCSSATEDDVSRVRSVLAIEAVQIRTDLGLDSAVVHDLRSLSDSSDAPLCTRLREAIQRHRGGTLSPTAHLSYFRAGSLYLVAASDPGRVRREPMLDGPDGGVFILGRDLRVRFRVAS